MERPTKKVRKVRKGEKDKKEKKVLVKTKKTQAKQTKTKSSRPKKSKQSSMLELLLLQQRPQATGLMPQMPPQMPINPAMIGNIRDRVSNLQKSSGSVVSEWVKLKAMLNDAKTAYSNGTLDENDIEELYKQAKKLGKSGFRTYQDLLATYTTAKGAYDFFVKYLNRNTPEGETNFRPPSPPPQPENQAPENQAPPPPQAPPQAPDTQPPDNQPPSPPPPNIPQSNTNYFYDKASQALNAINPLGGITGVEGGLLVGALGTAYQMRNLMSRNRLNRDIQVNQERGGRLANQIQQTAVQGLGNALAEAIPRAGVNSLQNLQQQINSDISEMDGILEGLDQAQTDLTRQHNIARSEAQRQLREQQRRPSLRETNREQVARQNLGEIERQTDIGRQNSFERAVERIEREGVFEKMRRKKTPEEKAEIARKARETRQQREQELEMEQRRLGLEAEYPSTDDLDMAEMEARFQELQRDDD